MKKRLFENVNGNTFKMLKENTESKPMHEAVVASGLKKVFENAKSKVTYKQVEAVGFGYIKDLTEAKNTAMKEARILAKEFNFKENEETGVFVKETETHPTQPNDEVAEQKEVRIGEQIIALIDNHIKKHGSAGRLGEIKKLAEDLIELHSPNGPVIKPGTTGTPMYKKGSVY
jgi:hypothetical protein